MLLFSSSYVFHCKLPWSWSHREQSIIGGWRTRNEEQWYATSESLNDAHCTSSLGSLKDRQGYCYNSFTYFSPLIFLVYSLHAPTSCLLFLVYILISFYRLSFLPCAALLPVFMHSLMHSTITHAQSCTVCLLMHSLIIQYIRTG